MPQIKKDGDTVHVDVDGPSPLPEVARWLHDYEPPNWKVRLSAEGAIMLATYCSDALSVAVDLLSLTVEVLLCYYSNYSISPTKYATATARAGAKGSASATIIE
jgi:hypothetical protein